MIDVSLSAAAVRRTSNNYHGADRTVNNAVADGVCLHQDDDVCGIDIESLHTTSLSTLNNIADVQRQSTIDFVKEHELMPFCRTLVTARSHRDLSRLINQFYFLAHTTKDYTPLSRAQ